MFHLSLAAARVNAGMTQKEAAETLRVGINSIINWENGHVQIPAKRIAELSEIYNVPIEFLMASEEISDGTLRGWTKIVIETDEDNPVTIATITEEKKEVAAGYRVRLTPKYD